MQFGDEDLDISCYLEISLMDADVGSMDIATLSAA